MIRRTVLLGIAGISLWKLYGCYVPIAKLRYRFNIAGVLGGKDFQGGTVLECRWWDTRLTAGFDAGTDWAEHIYGDAAIIDLGDKGLLFGLLKSIYVPDQLALNRRDHLSFQPSLDLVRTSLPEGGKLSHMKDGTIFDDLAIVKGDTEIERRAWPIFVRFRDIRDIRTVELVDPNNLAATYGVDGTINSITFGLTNDSISRGIESRLPWWKQLQSNYWSKVFGVGPNGHFLGVGQWPLYADLNAYNFKADVRA